MNQFFGQLTRRLLLLPGGLEHRLLGRLRRHHGGGVPAHPRPAPRPPEPPRVPPLLVGRLRPAVPPHAVRPVQGVPLAPSLRHLPLPDGRHGLGLPLVHRQPHGGLGGLWQEEGAALAAALLAALRAGGQLGLVLGAAGVAELGAEAREAEFVAGLRGEQAEEAVREEGEDK